MVATLNRFFSERTEDIYICALPLFHAYGKLQSFLSAVNIGASIVLISRFDTVAVMNAIARHRATVFFGVPTMYNMMVNSPDIGKYDLTSLRVCVSGGASMPMEILRAFEEKSGVSIAEGYGLSEVTVMTHCCPLTGVKKVGSIGHVMPGMRSKVVNEKDEDIPIGEVGELVLKGPSIMKGYYRKPEETEVAMRTGWFHTGDLVKKDEDGYYFIVDRIKDMYIRGGKNVYPREIEEVLYTYEGVREAAVIGVHDDKYGEEGLAFVVLKEGASVTAEELMAYLGDKVARFKLPKKIQFLNELPKNSIGKILKRELATNL
jgi:long-chain acyl-CoA synthetase